MYKRQGGHLANYVALTGGREEFDDPSMGNAEYSSKVQAVVSHYAITDMTTERNAQYLSLIHISR